MIAAHVLECTRSGVRKGDVVRFDTVTEAFGAMRSNGTIKTYFKPVPCSSLPAAQAAVSILAGKCHSKVSNLDYFRGEC